MIFLTTRHKHFSHRENIHQRSQVVYLLFIHWIVIVLRSTTQTHTHALEHRKLKKKILHVCLCISTQNIFIKIFEIFISPDHQ